jgi:succinoglycan biosynthesis transport protein ExoP
MELKQYLFLLKRWAWLLILGVVLGSAGAYVASTYQPLVYQTSTKVMVSRAPDDTSNNYTALNDFQLASTYSQLIVTEPVLQSVSSKLGFPIKSDQISVRQIPDALLLEITVRDSNPQRAATIANTLIDTFVSYNETLQSNRFASSEQSLNAQISQVQGQISSLQNEMTQSTQQNLQSQQQQVESRITDLEGQIKQLNDEIAQLSPPTPTPTAVPSNSRLYAYSPTATPEPTATLTPLAMAQLKAQQDLLQEKISERDQLKSILDLYQQVYANLLVFGAANPNNDQSTLQNQLQGTLALYQQIYSNLLTSYENVRLARLRSTPTVVQIEPAATPTIPIQPQPIRNGLLGGATGLLIMGAIAFLIEYLDDTLKSPEEIENQFGLPVIGFIAHFDPKQGDLITVKQPRSHVSEAFRSLRTNLQFSSVDHPVRSLLVTSPSPVEGKSTIAANLAVVMAQGGRHVALADADLRRPRIHQLLRLANRGGITSLFMPTKGLPNSQAPLNGHLQETGIINLRAMASGKLPPNPSELLGSGRMMAILKHIQEQADLLVLDSPPVLAVTDAVVLAPRVDGVVLVVKPGKTKLDACRQAIEQLQRVGAKILGVVFNDVEIKRLDYKYQYYRGYYNGHYYRDDKQSAKNRGGKGNADPGAASKSARKSSARPTHWTDQLEEYLHRIDRLNIFK